MGAARFSQLDESDSGSELSYEENIIGIGDIPEHMQVPYSIDMESTSGAAYTQASQPSLGISKQFAEEIDKLMSEEETGMRRAGRGAELVGDPDAGLDYSS